VPANSILVLQPDPVEALHITRALGSAGHPVTVVDDPEVLIGRSGEARLVILDALGGAVPTAAICRQLRARTALSDVPILCVSQEDELEERISLLEAGADDVIAKPFDGRELEARAEALLLRGASRRGGLTMAREGALSRSEGPRKTIACFGPKGGAGTTTIAANIAAIAAELRGERVVALDLRLQFGSLAAHFNVKGERTLADLVLDPEALTDADAFRTYALPYRDRVWVVPSPGSPDRAELVDAGAVEHLIRAAHSAAEIVVIDCGSTIDDRTLAAFDKAEVVVVPIVPELAGITALHTLLDYLRDVERQTGKLLVVLNHIFPNPPLQAAEIGRALGSPIAIELPYDKNLYVSSVNEGVPLGIRVPKSTPGERLRLLTRMALGMETDAARATGRDRRGLPALLRRA
jgi:pilus assembly protein CpaE